VARSESVTQTQEMIEECFIVVLCFPNFSKLRKFTIVKMNCLELLGQRDIRVDFRGVYCLFLYVENIHRYFIRKM
jgi:hypothetical protein